MDLPIESQAYLTVIAGRFCHMLWQDTILHGHREKRLKRLNFQVYNVCSRMGDFIYRLFSGKWIKRFHQMLTKFS